MSVSQKKSEYVQTKQIYTTYDKQHNHISHSLYLDACLCIHFHDAYNLDLRSKIINGFDAVFKNEDIHQHFFDLLQFYCESNKNIYRFNDEIFKICHRKNIVPIQYMLSKIVDYVTENTQHDKFNAIMNHIMRSANNVKKYVDDVVFCGILNGIIKTGQSGLFNDIWRKIYIQCGIQPNIECYRYALLASSLSSNDQSLLNGIITDVKNIYIKSDDVAQSRKETLYHHILTAYLNLNKYDKMWTEYNEMKDRYCIEPNLITLSILSAVNDKEYIMKSMKEIKEFLQRPTILTRRELLYLG